MLYFHILIYPNPFFKHLFPIISKYHFFYYHHKYFLTFLLEKSQFLLSKFLFLKNFLFDFLFVFVFFLFLFSFLNKVSFHLPFFNWESKYSNFIPKFIINFFSFRTLIIYPFNYHLYYYLLDICKNHHFMRIHHYLRFVYFLF